MRIEVDFSHKTLISKESNIIKVLEAIQVVVIIRISLSIMDITKSSIIIKANLDNISREVTPHNNQGLIKVMDSRDKWGSQTINLWGSLLVSL